MSFSICLNKNELLILAGFGLLYQGLTLDQRGKLIQDSQRLLCSVLEILERNNAPGAAEFKKVTCAMISIDRFQKNSRAENATVSSSRMNDTMPAPPKTISKSSRKLQAIASRFSSVNNPAVKRENGSRRRSTAPNPITGESPPCNRSQSQNSVSSVMSDPLTSQYTKQASSGRPRLDVRSIKPPNLDYLSFGSHTSPSHQQMSPTASKLHMKSDPNGNANWLMPEAHTPLDSLFPSADVFTCISPSPLGNIDWCPDRWNVPLDSGSQAPRSQISSSEEEITSGEEFSSCDLGGDVRGMTILVDGLAGLDALNGSYLL